MGINAEELKIEHNEAKHRYEVEVGGETAFADYTLTPGKISFTHTEVPDAVEGQGVGGKLVKSALDDARTKGLEVMPVCPFVAAYIKRHQEYLPIVDATYREALTRGK
ncbi:MAG: N-acetyltransferase [Chloroflexota bacterium]|nr:N-acetyltransferase [Chloroflexota bacterium]